MANHGPHTNHSQFFIALEAKKYLDLKYVAFGRVVVGSRIIDELENAQTFNERPVKAIKITKCEKLEWKWCISICKIIYTTLCKIVYLYFYTLNKIYFRKTHLSNVLIWVFWGFFLF